MELYVVDTAACAAPQINATSKCPSRSTKKKKTKQLFLMTSSAGGNNLPAWKIVLIILGVAGGLTVSNSHASDRIRFSEHHLLFFIVDRMHCSSNLLLWDRLWSLRWLEN